MKRRVIPLLTLVAAVTALGVPSASAASGTRTLAQSYQGSFCDTHNAVCPDTVSRKNYEG